MNFIIIILLWYAHCSTYNITKEWANIFTMSALWLWGCMVWHGHTVRENDRKRKIERQGVNRQMRARATWCMSYHINTGVTQQSMAWALTCDASRGHGQAERNVVFLVTHLPQEFKFQLAQNLSSTENCIIYWTACTCSVVHFIYPKLKLKHVRFVLPCCQ